jgi:hypothetical protein
MLPNKLAPAGPHPWPGLFSFARHPAPAAKFDEGACAFDDGGAPGAAYAGGW